MFTITNEISVLICQIENICQFANIISSIHCLPERKEPVNSLSFHKNLYHFRSAKIKNHKITTTISHDRL